MLITAAVIALVALVRRRKSAPGARPRLLSRARSLWRSVRRRADEVPQGLAAGAGAIALLCAALLTVPCAL